MEVPPEKASSYGVLDIQEDMGHVVKVKGMVEKPPAGQAPSNLAVIGRYILNPTVLRSLNQMKSGAGGEIQLTDAIASEVDGETGVFGPPFRGRRPRLQPPAIFGVVGREPFDSYCSLRV